MSTRFRLAILLSIALVAVVVFSFTGTSFMPYAQALPQVVQYTYPADDACEPVGIDSANAVQGTILGETRLYWEPDLGSPIGNLTLPAGQTFWIIASADAAGWYQIALGCDRVWLPAGTISVPGAVPAIDLE